MAESIRNAFKGTPLPCRLGGDEGADEPTSACPTGWQCPLPSEGAMHSRVRLRPPPCKALTRLAPGRAAEPGGGGGAGEPPAAEPEPVSPRPAAAEPASPRPAAASLSPQAAERGRAAGEDPPVGSGLLSGR